MTLVTSTGAFEPGVRGGPRRKHHTRDQWVRTQRSYRHTFVHRPRCLCEAFDFSSAAPLLSTPVDETAFCCARSCISLSLSRVLCLTKACCTHTRARGGFIKAGVRWTQQQWIKVFCMIKSLPRGGINLICERMLLRGNKVPKSSVILFVMS